MTVKKKLRRGIAMTAMVAVILLLVSGCAKSEIKSAISKFESSCQALDVKGMLECVDPAISKPMLGILDLLGVEDTSDTLDNLVGILGIFDNAGQETEEFVRSIKIDPSGYEFNDAKDECLVTAALSYGDGEKEPITIKMILTNGGWYISSIAF